MYRLHKKRLQINDLKRLKNIYAIIVYLEVKFQILFYN